MQEHHISVTKTARYFTAGELTERTRYVWFVLHGYGQLANKFLSFFEPFASEEHFFIAPEALNKFYWKGFGGKPVASWMTSEDRENEISDYLNYLDQLYAEMLPKHINAEKVVLGFSQGTATGTRWVAADNVDVQHLVMWSGPLAHDIDWDNAQHRFESIDSYLVIGKQDEFISEGDVAKQKEYLEQLGFDYTFLEFDGSHELHKETFLKIVGSIETHNA